MGVQSGIPRNFFRGRGSTNSVEERGQREWGSGGSSPLVRGSAQFANEWNTFLLGCYRCIFHGTGNSVQLCQNFGISRGGGVEPPNPTQYTNGCARTTVSRFARHNLTRQIFLTFMYLCSELYFLVLKHFIYFTLYNCMKIEKSEQKCRFGLNWVC
jgi:hypothetical protein